MPDSLTDSDALENLALEKLKQELSAKLKAVKKELHDTRFVQSAGGLINVKEDIAALSKPVVDLETNIKIAQSELQSMVERLDRRLQRRSRTRERKSFLKLLINIHDTLAKLEMLVDTTITQDDSSRVSSEKTYFGRSGTATSLIDSEGILVRDVLLLERVAIEYVHFQYLLTRGGHAPFVEALDSRIDRVAKVVDRSLVDLIDTTLTTFVSHDSSVISDNQPDDSLLTPALRICTLLNRMDVAVATYEENLLKEKVKKYISESRLGSDSIADQLQAAFTSLLSFYTSPLEGLLCSIRANVRHAEYMQFVVRTLQCYNSTVVFLGRFEDLFCIDLNIDTDLGTEMDAITFLRKSEIYITFMRKWQLDVYFQMRTKPIVNAVKDACSIATTLATLPTPKIEGQTIIGQDFLLSSTHSVLQALQQLWEPEIFLFALGHRFWKLTIQLVLRYLLWVRSIVQDDQKTNVNSSSIQPSSLSATHHRNGSTSSLQSIEGPLNGVATGTDAEQQILRSCLVLHHDLRTLPAYILNLLSNHITKACALTRTQYIAVRKTLTSTCAQLETPVSTLDEHITTIVIRRCCEALKLLRNVTSQYRGTNKPMPLAPSYFVANLLQPAMQFHKDFNAIISDKIWLGWLSTIIETVSRRYHNTLIHLLADIKKTEESLRRLKRSKGTLNNTTEDEDKMRYQLYLDVEQYVADVHQTLHVEPTVELDALSALLSVVSEFQELAQPRLQE